MAIKKSNGELKGTVGPTVHFERNGKQIMRVKTAHRTDKSQAVFDSRNDFAVIMNLIRKFKRLIDKGFKDHKVNRSAYHSALSVNRLNYNFAKKTTGIENLDWFQFSEGNLSNATEVSAHMTEDGKVEIVWEGTERGLTAHPDDEVVTCIFLNDSFSLYPGPEGVTRSAGRLIVDQGKPRLTGKIEAFIAFRVSNDNYRPGSDRNVSKSRWIGVVPPHPKPLY